MIKRWALVRVLQKKADSIGCIYTEIYFKNLAMPACRLASLKSAGQAGRLGVSRRTDVAVTKSRTV